MKCKIMSDGRDDTETHNNKIVDSCGLSGASQACISENCKSACEMCSKGKLIAVSNMIMMKCRDICE